MDKLKKCPFCGGDVNLFIGFMAGLPMIVCGKCSATVSFGGKETKEQTIKAWNRREKDV